MNSADFLSFIRDYSAKQLLFNDRISLGHALGYFGHSLPAFYVIFLCVHIAKSKTPLVVVTTHKDYLLYIGPFRHSVTRDALSSTMKVDLHHLVQCAARRIYFVQDPGTYSR